MQPSTKRYYEDWSDRSLPLIFFAVNHIIKRALQMSDGQIPMNAEDLPISNVVLDESLVQNVRLEKLTLSPKTDKNGKTYVSMLVIVKEGDYEGCPLAANYLPTPITPADDSKKEAVKAQNNNAKFGRFVRSFRIRGAIPPMNAQLLTNEDARQKFQEWCDAQVGNDGKVSVENSTWQGNERSAIRDFIVG